MEFELKLPDRNQLVASGTHLASAISAAWSIVSFPASHFPAETTDEDDLISTLDGDLLARRRTPRSSSAISLLGQVRPITRMNDHYGPKSLSLSEPVDAVAASAGPLTSSSPPPSPGELLAILTHADRQTDKRKKAGAELKPPAG